MLEFFFCCCSNSNAMTSLHAVAHYTWVCCNFTLWPKVVKVEHITDGLWCMGACGTDFHDTTASPLKEILADLSHPFLAMLSQVRNCQGNLLVLLYHLCIGRIEMSSTAYRKSLGRISSLTLAKLKAIMLLLLFDRERTLWVSVSECKHEKLCTSTVYNSTFQLLSLVEFA